jgi:peptidoglycan LD-endopeptidase CwlK
MAVDERSEKNIATLNPKVQPLARKLIETATAQGIHVKVISGHRTYEEQNDLYAQESNHNFATAFDVGIFSADGKKYIEESNAYDEVGKIGEALGLEWGGSWKFYDAPHFQYNEGRSMAQLREAYEEHGDALV